MSEVVRVRRGVGSPRRARLRRSAPARERVAGVVRMVERDERAEAHAPRSHDRAERSAGRDRDGDRGRAGHRLHQRQAAVCPRRCAATSARAERRRDDRRAAHVARSRALSEIAPRRRNSPPTNGAVGAPTTRSRRPVARSTATASAAGSKTPKPRFATMTAPPVVRHVLGAGDVRRGPRTRTSGRDQVGELRIEPERVDRIAAAEPAAQRLQQRARSPRRGRCPAVVGAGRSSSGSTVAPVMPPPRARSAIGHDVGPLEQLAQHVLRRAQIGEAERARWRGRSNRCGRGGAARRRAARSPRPRPRSARATARQNGGSTGSGTRPPRRAACHGVAAPGPTMLQRAVVAALDRGDHRAGGVVGMQQRERRIGERAAPARPAAAAAARAGSGRANRRPARSATRTRRHARSGARRPCRDRFDLRAATRRTRVRGAGTTSLVGHRRVQRTRAVHLEPAAHHDVLEVAGVRGGAQRRDRAQLGALGRRRRRHARRRFVDAEVRDDVRRELLDELRRACRGRAGRCAGTRRAAGAGGAGRSRRRRSPSAHARCSISCATRVPSSPPIPVTRDSLVRSRSFCLRAQVREEDHFADRRDAGEQHHQPVDAHAHAAGRRQAVLERAHVVGVDAVRLDVAELASASPALRSAAAGRPDRSAR